MVNYYFRIKITLKLAQTHQSIGNSQTMLLELKEVSSKSSGKLLFFWNKNNIITCSNTSINKNLTRYVVRIKRGQYRKKSDKLLFWNKITLKLAQTHQSIGNSQSMLLELKEVSRKRSGKLLFSNKNNINTCSNTLINRKLTD